MALLMPGAELIKCCEAVGMSWFRDSDPSLPHVALSDERCADGWLHESLCSGSSRTHAVSRQFLIFVLGQHLGFDYVVTVGEGPAHFAWYLLDIPCITLKDLRKRGRGTVSFGYSSNRCVNVEYGQTTQRFSVLLAYNAIRDTPDNRGEVDEMIRAHGGQLCTRVAALFSCPTKIQLGYKTDPSVVALITRPIQTWPKAECPLCEAGSARIDPTKDWEKLVGRK